MATEAELLYMRAAISPDPNTREALRTAITTPPALTTNPAILGFIDTALRYSDTTQHPLTEDAAGAYAPLLRALQPLLEPAPLHWAVHQTRAQQTEDRYADALVKSLEILKADRKAAHEARLQASLAYLLARLPTTEERAHPEHADLKSIYLARKETGPTGALTGLNVIDTLTDGQNNAELWIVGGYTGQGKSFMLGTITYNRRIYQKKRQLLVATEQTLTEIKTRLCVLHSRHEKFGKPDGLSATDIKKAELTPDEEALWFDVIKDWEDEAGNYPELDTVTMPAGTPLQNVFDRAEAIDKQAPLDAVTIDYLTQMLPRGAQSARDPNQLLSPLITQCKAGALNFRNKRGIPVLTAAQTNPESFKKALEDGRYPLRSIANTAEAERSADLLMTILRSQRDEEKLELRGTILKYRHGPSSLDYVMEADYDKSWIGDKTVLDREDSTWRLGL